MYLRQAAANLLRRFHAPSRIVSSSGGTTINALPLPLSSKIKIPNQYGSEGYTWRTNQKDSNLWMIMFAPAAIFFGINPNPVLAEDLSVQTNSENEGTNGIGLRKIDDDSVISNIHTSKWRVFTDSGRDFFSKGKLEEAEKLFLSALEEAKEGFGEKDPHVASACNNLAELYRIKKAFHKAEPLYLDAINILEESYGPEDIRVGVALHNLGKFYLIQRKLEDARICYERALKIKGRVLGHSHIDYADAMYHLGTVLNLQGKEKDSEALFLDSIRILEELGPGESMTFIRRMRHLTRIYLKANRLAEAENLQRKALHVMELSKEWNPLETAFVAEGLALTLQSTGNFKEAQELFEKCLDARKSLLPHDHIQIGANMLHIARVALLNSNRLREMHVSEAVAELGRVKELLDNSTRIARHVLNRSIKQKGKKQNYGASGETIRDVRAAMIILLQSIDALGLLEITKQDLQESKGKNVPMHDAETALFQCISAYKEFGTEKSISDSLEVKAEYLSCLKRLSSLIGNATSTGGTNLQELKDEMKRVEEEIPSYRRSKQ